MAIDFGRMIQGVATGAMGQVNAEVAAKDKMKGEIIQRAGLTFLQPSLNQLGQNALTISQVKSFL